MHKSSLTPLVSVVIPVYNGANYLQEAIDSVLEQTYSNIEVLVVNDGSNDQGQTEAIARSYGDKVQYLYKDNGGVATALNLGIEYMRGEYFAWLSHDDVWPSGKIQAQIDCLAGLPSHQTIIFGDYAVTDSALRTKYVVHMDHALAMQKPLYTVFRGMLNGCTMLIPKECFDTVGFFKELPTTQDYEMWFRLVRLFPIYHLQEILLYSRQHDVQGSLAQTAVEEASTLWINLMSSLTPEEILSLEESPLRFYEGMVAFFSDKPYNKAAEFALARVCQEKNSSLAKGGRIDFWSSVYALCKRSRRVLSSISLLSKCYSFFKKNRPDNINDVRSVKCVADFYPVLIKEIHSPSSGRICTNNKSKEPLISVVVPTHNRAYCLHLAVASVMAQTWKNIEIVIVDDASTDWTGQLCLRLQNSYPNCFKIIKNDVQLGVSASRNKGIEAASGEYISFLDSDDFFHPDKLALQISELQQHPCASFATCWYSYFDVVKQVVHHVEFLDQEIVYPNSLLPAKTTLVTPSILMPKRTLDSVGLFDESVKICEDIDLWTRALQIGPAVLVPQDLVTVVGGQSPKDEDYYTFCVARDVLYQNAFKRDLSLSDDFKMKLYIDLIDIYSNIIDTKHPLFGIFTMLLNAKNLPYQEWYALFAKQVLERSPIINSSKLSKC